MRRPAAAATSGDVDHVARPAPSAPGRPVYDDGVSRALAIVGLVSLVLIGPVAGARAEGDAAASGALGVASAAQAQGRVAIVPFTGDGRMALYGQPVAAQVAKVGRAAGLEVVLLAAGAEVPGDVRLVVDGRLVKSGAAIVLEARVRDPERGLDVARRSATAATLAVVDRAADEVAAALVPAIRAGLLAQDEARARSRAALAPAITAVVTPPGDAGHPAVVDPIAPAAVDDRPLALIALTGALAGPDGQAQGIAPLVTSSLVRLADGIGHRAAPLGEAGVTAPAEVVARGEGALAIVIAVLAVDSDGRAIPQARARARVDVYDRTGLIYRRTIRTDTLVGSRGDRVDTLVRSAVAQVVDVVAPRLREHLAARRPAP